MRIVVTGHRPDKLGGYNRDNPLRTHLCQRLRTLLISLAADATCRGDRSVELVTGGALGWDQDCAGVALRVGIPYTLYVPFVGQDSRWPKPSRDVYAEVVKRASKIVLCHDDRPQSDGHTGRLLLERNKRMIDDAHADYLVAAWDGSTGGTSHCVRYASGKVGMIVNLLARDWSGRDVREIMGDWEYNEVRASKDGAKCL